MTISKTVRKAVTRRAKDRCEYCQIPRFFVHASMQVDHIKPLSLDGTDDEDNLCLSCPYCNSFKKAKPQAADPLTGDNVLLFNPREQHWLEHFEWGEDRATIIGRSACGRATVAALKMNVPDRLRSRLFIATTKRYPPVDMV